MKRLALAAVLLLATVANGQDGEMRPFVVRWDDTAETVIDLSFLSPGEAGAEGPVIVSDDGYLTTGGERLKLFGQNVGGGTVFADGVSDGQRAAFAGRLRKFGFNAVRFHHLGATWFDRNAFGPVADERNEATTQFDPESLDRLHRWVAAFKEHGIYTNMNLLVSRRFVPEDGLPESVDAIGWKLQGTAAMWHPRLIELQKDYARQLLSSDNPHAGVPLASDPSLATVEINNENGILHSWLAGDVDDVPADLLEPLRAMWNDWLRERNGDDAALATAWGAADVPIGEEMLTGNFAVTTQGGAFATVAGGTVVVVRPGTEGWHVQYAHGGLSIEAGEPYTLSFEARADSPRTVRVDLRQAHDPWRLLGFETAIDLTDQWKRFEFVALPTVGDADARVTFDGLSQDGASYEFRDVSLKPGGKVGGVTTLGDVPVPKRGETMTLPQRRDWFAFCMDAERAYFGEMRRFLKEDLGVVAPVVGTIVGCSPMGVQKEMDAIDTHAYWRHPEFPGEGWDPENWVVRPDSMVNHPESAAILGPMLRQVRVDGRRLPHMLTEYDHPAPNPHAGEAPLFLAAYAALQDFDAVYLFAYDVDFAEEPGKIGGFFDDANHPTKMANCIPAALMFRRGGIPRAPRESVVDVQGEEELAALVERGGAWRMVDYGDLGGDRLAAYTDRVAVNFLTGGGDGDPATRPSPTRFMDSPATWVSWSAEEFHDQPLAIKPNLHVVTGGFFGGWGYGVGTEWYATDDRVTIALKTADDAWSTVVLSSMGGDGLIGLGKKRALLVATGDYANTGWQWKSDAHLSLGTDWGTAPTLIEVVPVTLTLKAQKACRAWALDATGKRVEEVAVELDGGTATVRVGPGHTETATLFYEIEWE